MATIHTQATSQPLTLNLEGLLPREPQPLETPFVICVDSREQQPFNFSNMKADADRNHRPLTVRTQFEFLGDGMGDYTLQGFRGLISIERKSLADAHNTIISYGDRRRQWETELENLNAMEFAAVVIEATLEQTLAAVEQWGVKTVEQNRKTLFSSVQAWQQRFPRVQWCWCPGRRFAELYTFRLLERFYERKQRELRRKKRARK